MAVKTYRFRETLSDDIAYDFQDGKNVAQSVCEFVDVVKQVDEETLKGHVSSGGVEKWVVFEQAGKTAKFAKLRERLQAEEVGNLRGEILKIVFSYRWWLEEANRIRAQAGWRFWLRLGIIVVLGALGIAQQSWIFGGIAIALAIMLLSAYFLGSFTAFKVDKAIPRSVYDTVKFAVYVLLGSVSAVLGLIAISERTMTLPIIFLLVSLFMGIFAILNLVGISEESEAKIEVKDKTGSEERTTGRTTPRIVLNVAVWDWVETIVLFQLLFFMLGLTALGFTILNS